MPIVEINYLAVLVAAIASMVLGMIWYSVFGKTWMALSGMTEEKLNEVKNKGMAKSYLIAFIAALVMSYVLAYIIGGLELNTVSGGLQAGFWVWLGFVATKSLGTVLWEGKSPKLYLFNNAYDLISLLVAGAILAVWA